MNQELVAKPAETAVKCIVWGRVVDYVPLLRRFEVNHPVDGQTVLDDQFVQLYETVRNKTGIAPEDFKHTHGSGFAIVSSAEEVDRLAGTLLDILAEANSFINDQRDHKKLAIGATEWVSAPSKDSRPDVGHWQAFKEVSELADKASAFEIRLSSAVFRALPDELKKCYEPVEDKQNPGRGSVKSWRRNCGVSRSGLSCVMRVDMSRSNAIRAKLIIAMKSEAAGKEVQNQISQIIADGFNRVEPGLLDRCYRVFGGDGGLFMLPDPTQAHKVAIEILNRADEFSQAARDANIELGMRCFRIGIDVGNLTTDNAGEYDGGALANVTRLEAGGPTGEIRMSETAYRMLPEDLRRKYGDKEIIQGKGTDLGGIPGRRFDATRPAPWPEVDENNKPYANVKRPNADFENVAARRAIPCFVICPFTDPNGRAKRVFNGLIKPACDQLGMKAERADQFPGDRKQLIKEKLKSSAIVIAYLGNSDEGLNGNIILEVGYRLATGKPLVIMCDAKANGEIPDYQAILPIQLNSDNIITLGIDPEEKIAALCSEINAVKGRKHTEEWDTPYPMVMYRFTNPNTDVMIEESNLAARVLFGEDAVRVGDSSERMRAVFAETIELAQRDARKAEFMDMFPTLIAFSMMQESGSHPNKEIPLSRIPLVFKNSPPDPRTRKPRGYLPVLTRWSYEAGVCRIRYMYLPVSNAMRMDTDLGYYVCDL